MEHRIKINLFWSVLVLAGTVGASVVTSVAVATSGFVARGREQTSQAHEVVVKGQAKARVRSDMCHWIIRIHGRGETLAEAFEDLAQGVGSLRGFLDRAGFHDDELIMSAISTQTHYRTDDRGRPTHEVLGQTLTREIEVVSMRVDLVSETVGQVTELIRDGIAVVSTPPQYTFAGLDDMRISLAAAAALDARQRANAIAQNAGSRVATVRKAAMGVVQVTRPDSTEVSGYGMYDTSTIDKDVTVVVTLTLGLERLD